jgi:hypothetical protein
VVSIPLRDQQLKQKREKQKEERIQNILHIFCGNIIKIQSSNSLANYYLHNFNNVRKIEIIKRWK